MKMEHHPSLAGSWAFLTVLFGACLLAGVLPARAQSDYITTVENTPNLLGYWRFSPASQANSEVNGYTGTFMGNAAVGPANSGPSIVGDSSNSAVLLDGTTNTFVSTSLTGQIDQQGSIVGWFYLAQLPSDAGRFFYIAGESQAGDDFDFQIETDNMLKFYTEAGAHTTDPVALIAADLNKWHFVAATYTAGTTRNIYLDGNLVGSSVPGGHSVNSSAFNMGASDVFGGRFFNGRLDEMAIFDRELSATEVANIYASAGLPVIISPLSASATVGQPFVYQFEASGATTLAVTNLPAGLTFDPSLSAIVGTPTAAGTFQVALSASNADGTTTATLTLTLQPAPSSGPVVMSSTSATGRTGQPFGFQVITSGASSLARLSASGFPAGLSVDPVTGLISGTETVDGSFSVTLTVTDGSLTATATLELTFSSDLGLPVITSPSTATLVTGQPFTYQIVAPTSDSSDPVTYALVGTLPPGLGFDPVTGIISGTFQTHLSSQQPGPLLSGGVVTNVQLFATNSHGTATIPLTFFLAPTGALNISTRLAVGTGDDGLIGGFIITGNAPKKVIIRAIGPSLESNGVPLAGRLLDPTLELHDSNGLISSNDNWRDSQEQEIIDTTIPPTDDRESAIVATLAPLDSSVAGSGAYTVIVSGKNATTGVALVEVYDLGTASFDISSLAQLANISTRGKVQTGDDAMIGGFILGGSTATNVLLRAIGPELTAEGVTGALSDTTLELHDSSGTLVASNDDWQSDQMQQIIDTGVPPTDPRESAVVASLNPGAYTGIVRGKDNTIGVALVEVYVLP